MLDRGYSGGLPTALRMEFRRAERAQMHLHEGDGLRLSRVPVLRHHHLPRSADRGILRSHIPRDREAGQSRVPAKRTTK